MAGFAAAKHDPVAIRRKEQDVRAATHRAIPVRLAVDLRSGVCDDAVVSKDPPLINESTVEAFERARRESKAPASANAVSVGTLNQLIATLRGAAAVWRAAQGAADADRVAAETAALSHHTVGFKVVVAKKSDQAAISS